MSEYIELTEPCGVLTVPGVREYVCRLEPVGEGTVNVTVCAPTEPIVRCRDCKHFKRTTPCRAYTDTIRMREFVDAHREGRTWKELREMLAYEGLYYKSAECLANSYYHATKRHNTSRCLKFGTDDPNGFCAWGERRDA